MTENKFKPDEQIWPMQRPKCANPECSNKGFVLMKGKWYCGECVAKLIRIQEEEATKYIFEKLNKND